MNAAITCYDDPGITYKIDFRHAGDGERMASPDKSRSPRYRRRKSPVAFNGIHRRRAKRIRW